MGLQSPMYLGVRCDGCGLEEDLVCTEYQPWPAAKPWLRTYGVDPATLQCEQWLEEGEKLFCPRCANAMECRDEYQRSEE